MQFVRYVTRLAAAAAEVAVWAQPALVPLVGTVAGVGRVLPLHDGSPDVAYDVDVEVMELPHVFRSDVRTLPATVPYLHVAPVGSAAVAAARAAGRVVAGVVWRAGDWDGRRSVPVELLANRLAVPGVDWFVLQRGAAGPAGFGVDVGSDDVAAAAAVMRDLDLVVTVDSLPAHLAGALGVPVWTLLHADADWRWMDDREDSPWYPTMRLFRQNRDRPGDWGPVLDRVAVELGRVAAEGRTGRV